MVPGGRPVDLIHRFLLEGLDQFHLRFVLLHHCVEGAVDARRFAVHKAEPVALWLPREGNDGRVDLKHLNGHVALLKTEQLERIRLGVLALLPVHLDREISAVGVPEHGDFGHREQILLPQLLPGGDVNKHHARGRLPGVLPRDVGRDDVLRGRPLKLLDARQFDRLFVEEFEVGGGVDLNGVVGQLGKVLAVVAPHKGLHSLVLRALILKRALFFASAHVPDNHGLGVFIDFLARVRPCGRHQKRLAR
mmetsp:Transcript_65486/g.55571  ORF Transcript_65486/g.55571 Transcript_65486/m.55571 type:complete len:249 (-) Transcript_65486:619-1365(-)